MNLATSVMGLPLAHPIIAGASPLGRTLDLVICDHNRRSLHAYGSRYASRLDGSVHAGRGEGRRDQRRQRRHVKGLLRRHERATQSRFLNHFVGPVRGHQDDGRLRRQHPNRGKNRQVPGACMCCTWRM